jgi:thiol-disulfide isomerase/thioredoxin
MKSTLLLLLSFAVFSMSCEKKDLVDTSKNDLLDIDTKTDFDAAIASGVSFAFFHASWCENCEEQRPAIESAQKNPAVDFVQFIEVEYEDNDEIVKAYNVPGFPTMLVFKDGMEKERFQGKGHSEQQFIDALNKHK